MSSSMSEERAARILGVSLGCDMEELRSAYRAAVRDANPEKSEKGSSSGPNGGLNGRERFQEISAAYTLLASSSERPKSKHANGKILNREGKNVDSVLGGDVPMAVKGSFMSGSGGSSGKKKKKRNASNNSTSNMMPNGMLLPTSPDLAQMWSHRELLSRHSNLEEVSGSGVTGGRHVFGSSNSGGRQKKNGVKSSGINGAAGSSDSSGMGSADVSLDVTAAAAAAALGFMNSSPSGPYGDGCGGNGASEFWKGNPAMGGNGKDALPSNCSEAEMKALMSMFVEFMGMFSDQEPPAGGGKSFQFPHDVEDVDPSFFQKLRMSMASNPDASGPAAAAAGFPVFSMMFEGATGKDGCKVNGDTFDKWVEYYNNNDVDEGGEETEDEDGDNTGSSRWDSSSEPEPSAGMTLAALTKLREAITASNLHVSSEKGFFRCSTSGASGDKASSADKNGSNGNSAASKKADTKTECQGKSSEVNDDEEELKISAEDDRSKKVEKKRDKKSRRKEKARQEAAERAAQAAKKRRETKIASWRTRVVTAIASGESSKVDALLSDSPFKKGKSNGNDEQQSTTSSEQMSEQHEELMQHMEWLARASLPKSRKARISASLSEKEAREKVASYVMETAFDAILVPGRPGRSALHTACSLGDIVFVKIALQRYSEASKFGTKQHLLDVLDVLCEDSGWSPLHYAAANGSVEVMEKLLAAGCNVSCKTNAALTCRSSKRNGVTPRELSETVFSNQTSSLNCKGSALEEAEAGLNEDRPRTAVKSLHQRIVGRLTEVEKRGYFPPSSVDTSFTDETSGSVKDENKSAANGTESKKKKRNKKKKQQAAQAASVAKSNGADSKNPSGNEKASAVHASQSTTDPLITALHAMGFSEEQVSAAVEACGGTDRATADDLVQWILEKESGGSGGNEATTPSANDDAINESDRQSFGGPIQISDGEQQKQERLAASAAAKAKKEALAAAEREAAAAAAKRLAAKREEQRRINREWNNREQMRQRDQARAKLVEEADRRRKAEAERQRAEALRQAKERSLVGHYPMTQGSVSARGVPAQQHIAFPARVGRGSSLPGGSSVSHTQAFPNESAHVISLVPKNAVNAPAPSLNPSFGQNQQKKHAGGIHTIYQKHEQGQNTSSGRHDGFDHTHIPHSSDNFREGFGHQESSDQFGQMHVDEYGSAPAYYVEPEETQRVEVCPIDFPELGKEVDGKSGHDLKAEAIHNDDKHPEVPTNVDNQNQQAPQSGKSKYLDIPVDEEPNHSGVIRATAKAFVPRFGANAGTVSASTAPAAPQVLATTPPPGLDSSSPPRLTGASVVPGANFAGSSLPGLTDISTSTLLDSSSLPDHVTSSNLWAPATSLSSSKPASGVASPVGAEAQSPMPPTTSILASLSPSLVANATGDGMAVPALHQSPVPSSSSSLTGNDNLSFVFSGKKESGGTTRFEPPSANVGEQGNNQEPFPSVVGSSIWGASSGGTTGLGGLGLGFGQSSGFASDQFSGLPGESKEGSATIGINWGTTTDSTKNNIW